jgi:Rhodanese-like domain
VGVSLGFCVAVGIIGADRILASTQTKSDQPKVPDIQSITAEELKAKVTQKEPVTIIDVRASDAYVSSENKIEGAIFVRFRRLRARLAQPPLKDVPRDREVVT